MSVLIAEYMDLELHRQILCNKVYSLFLSLGQTYHMEQTALWEESLQVCVDFGVDLLLSVPICVELKCPRACSPLSLRHFFFIFVTESNLLVLGIRQPAGRHDCAHREHGSAQPYSGISFCEAVKS